MKYDKPTFGKLRISEDGSSIETDDSASLGICAMYATERATANAERIVDSWNSYDSAKDLLSEFVKMANDHTYGDLVWRLALKEKAQAWLRNNGGEF